MRFIELTPKDIRQIELLAGFGHTEAEIALLLDFSERTFRNKKATDDEVHAAWTRGKLKARAVVGSIAFRNALDGDQRAVEYYEATRFGITVKGAEKGLAPGDEEDDPTAIADPHDELLRRYEIIAQRQAAAEAAADERLQEADARRVG